jgi:2',3'-cyclic-nucleotide 2'-phosphodiesterase (5'-nucleotidase family)
MKKIKAFAALITAFILIITAVSCGKAPQTAEAEKNGEVIILYTSDIHCGIDKGFGLAGLRQIRDKLEKDGYTTLLVDNGDATQGESIGMLSKGEAIIDLMTAVEYDVATIGNHDFDYGMETFFSLVEKADFPYVSCNFVKEGKPVFDPYIIKEAAGIKIAFVGITTPETIASSTPAYFQNSDGEFIYGFMSDETGEAVYSAVQKAVDSARAEGADYVYALGHIGNDPSSSPWTSEEIIKNTSGIDVFLDGHSHDTNQLVIKNKDGKDVARSACGTKLNNIGYSRISPDEGVAQTDIFSWNNDKSAAELFGIENEIKTKVDAALSALEERLNRVVAKSDVDLTINDPELEDESGNPVRIIRVSETNLGDLCADAIMADTGADISIVNGGGIRTSISKGDITYGDIISVFPFNNEICVIKATGQQILDALEWGAKEVPNEFGGFLQTAGLSYEIDVSVPSPCVADENSMCKGFEGERRVKNAMVGNQPIDPEKTYTVAGSVYVLLNNGDGSTAFNKAELIEKSTKLDNQILIDYIVNDLKGNVGSEYSAPGGQGRITISSETAGK